MTQPRISLITIVKPDKSDTYHITATGFDSEVEVLDLLLAVVRKITGVSTETYEHLVVECYRIAAREQTQNTADEPTPSEPHDA